MLLQIPTKCHHVPPNCEPSRKVLWRFFWYLLWYVAQHTLLGSQLSSSYPTVPIAMYPVFRFCSYPTVPISSCGKSQRFASSFFLFGMFAMHTLHTVRHSMSAMIAFDDHTTSLVPQHGMKDFALDSFPRMKVLCSKLAINGIVIMALLTWPHDAHTTYYSNPAQA